RAGVASASAARPGGIRRALEAGIVELNTRGRYAVTAMADLARYGAQGALALSTIAERQQISLAYLEQLFLKLRRAGLVESARGRSGGYRLRRAGRRHPLAPACAGGGGRHPHDALQRRSRQALHSGPPLPHPRIVGCAGRSDRRLPAKRDPARGDRRHPGGQASHARRPGPTFGAVRTGERMRQVRTYLDWNATAPLRREARAAMLEALAVVGNPSSPHQEGRRARATR